MNLEKARAERIINFSCSFQRYLQLLQTLSIDMVVGGELVRAAANPQEVPVCDAPEATFHSDNLCANFRNGRQGHIAPLGGGHLCWNKFCLGAEHQLGLRGGNVPVKCPTPRAAICGELRTPMGRDILHASYRRFGLTAVKISWKSPPFGGTGRLVN